MRRFFDDYMKYNIPFWIFAGVSIALIITAFLLPPLAIIDKSVLEGVGEIFGFAGLWTVIVAIEKGGVKRYRKGDMEVEFEKRDNHQINEDI